MYVDANRSTVLPSNIYDLSFINPPFEKPLVSAMLIENFYARIRTNTDNEICTCNVSSCYVKTYALGATF